MLRHEGYHQLQHIMQILILQTNQERKTIRDRQKEEGAGEEREYIFCSLLRLYNCNCSKDVTYVPCPPGPLAHLTTVQGQWLAIANRND